MRSPNNVFSRHVSAQDIAYSYAGSRLHHANQIICQCIVEGRGVIALEALQAAIETVAEALPACRMVIRGHWKFKQWRADGPLPAVRQMHFDWDGQYRDGLPFLDQPLDLHTGPIAEIIQVTGEKTYLVFRIHHAVMDGVSTVLFIENFFRALRKEPVPVFNSPITWEDLTSRFSRRPKPNNVLHQALTPLGAQRKVSDGDESPRIWHRITIAGNDLLTLPKIMLTLAQVARESASGKVRWQIPIDMRRHLQTEKSLANLIGLVMIDIEEDDSVRSIVKKFNQQLADNQDIPAPLPTPLRMLLRWTPHVMLLPFIQWLSQQVLKRPFFNTSGTISTVGKISLAAYSTDHFIAESVFGIPIDRLRSAIFVTLSSNENQTDVLLGTSSAMGADHALEQLGVRLATSLGRVLRQ